jgi:hypothetical protein
MAIATLDAYIAAAKQNLTLAKTATRTSIAVFPFSVFDLAGNPGAGTLAGTSTTAGVVPTDATAGCPLINAFGGGAAGYLARVQFASTVACRITLYDLLFKAGAYAFNANTALSAQPSYSGRLPGTNYVGLQIWVETVTAATGNQTWNVTYTNQAGTGSRTTGAVGIGAAPTLGRMWQLPLQAGDSGVQKIDNVQGGTGSAGTANILVLRRLWEGRVPVAASGGSDDLLKTGLPEIYADSALYMIITADSTSTGIPDMAVEVANA